MIRKMCGVKISDRKNTSELVVKRSGMRWMGHVLRREEDEPVKKAWDLHVDGIRTKGRPKVSWKDMVKKECRRVGLKEEDAQDRKKCGEGVSSWRESQ